MWQNAFGRVFSAVTSASSGSTCHTDDGIHGAGSSTMAHDHNPMPMPNGTRPLAIPDSLNNGIPGLSLIPSKRKSSPAKANRSPKLTKLSGPPNPTPPSNTEIIDLISDDEDASSSATATSSASMSISTTSEKQSIDGAATERTSLIAHSTNNFAVGIVEKKSARPLGSGAGLQGDLSDLKDNDLYSMFIKEEEGPPDKNNESSDEDSAGALFGSTKPRSQLFISQDDRTARPSADSARVKEYRERSELGAIDASRMLREGALAKAQEAPKNNAMPLPQTEELPVIQRKEATTLPNVATSIQHKVTQMLQIQRPQHPESQGPKWLKHTFHQIGPEAPKATEQTLHHPQPDATKPLKQTLPHPEPDAPKPLKQTLHQTEPAALKPLRETLHPGSEVLPTPRENLQSPPEAPKVQRGALQPESTAQVVSELVYTPSTKFVPEVIELTDQDCREDSGTPEKQAPKYAPHWPTSRIAVAASSQETEENERSEQLMKFIMNNQNARQKHAKLVSNLIPTKPSASRFNQPFQGSSVSRKPMGIDQLLGNNVNSALRLADAQKVRYASYSDPDPPSSIREPSTSGVPPTHKGAFKNSEDSDLKSIRDKKSTWDALSKAVTHASHLLKTCGLDDTTVKELKEMRYFENRVSSGENLNTAERRRIQDISKNMRRREESKVLRVTIETGRPPEPPRLSRPEASRVQAFLNWLQDVHQKAEQATSDLQTKNLKKLETERSRKREERLAQDKARRKRNAEQKESMLRSRLRLYEDAEERRGLTNGAESESDEDEPERGASPDSTSSVISDEDDGFIRVVKVPERPHEGASSTSRPSGERPRVGNKGVSERTLEILRQEDLVNCNGLKVLEPAHENENLAQRPTTGGKTISLEAFQRCMGIADQPCPVEDEEDTSDSEDEDLYMYQIRLVEYGGPTDTGTGVEEYLGSYYTLAEANKRASRAAMQIPSTPAERTSIDSRVTVHDGVFSYTMTYASGRSVAVRIEPVAVRVREADLRPRDYRVPSKVWIVYQKVFHRPECTTNNLFEETAIPEPYQTTQGVFTLLQRANKMASDCLVRQLTEDSPKAGDIAYKAEIEMKARQYMKELNGNGALFSSTEDIPGTEGGKVRAWVEECLVQGPRN